MMARIDDIRAELAKIRRADKYNNIQPEAVVDYARKNKSSALHEQFEWDDTAAAELYRLKQARDIIRVGVTVITSADSKTVVSVSEYISLPDRRGEGYEHIEDVMKDPERSEVLLHSVITRLLSIKEVSLFTELVPVHRAINKAAATYLPKEKEGGKEKSVSVRVGREARL